MSGPQLCQTEFEKLVTMSCIQQPKPKFLLQLQSHSFCQGALETVGNMFGTNEAQEIRKVPLSHNTVRRCMDGRSNDPETPSLEDYYIKQASTED